METFAFFIVGKLLHRTICMIFYMHVLCFMEFSLACKNSLLAMIPYSKEEKAKIVQFYWESKSVVVTQRKFVSHFKTRKHHHIAAFYV